MKIYTKTGDKGITSLFGGRRISKDDLRIEAYGTVDELNSNIGLLASDVTEEKLKLKLKEIQIYLFVIGSNLAADPENTQIKLPELKAAEVEFLEKEIDLMEINLKPLSYFILPGGDHQASLAHICRTICRRAERRVVSLSQLEPVSNEIIIYLNRLSDYLFVLSRYIAHLNNSEEIYWKP